MSASFTIEFDGRTVEAQAGETLWQIARRSGIEIEHLCLKDAPGYRADGNCRACLVEVVGERTLSASCRRQATPGMVVSSAGDRARSARRGVIELLMASSPGSADDPRSLVARWADKMGIARTRYAPRRDASDVTERVRDDSHRAIVFNAGACIHCGLCVRACREIQVNDVIGMAGRGARTHVAFDQDDALGESTCVACGECVQACPTGALSSAAPETWKIDDEDRHVRSLCPYCGVGCQVDYTVRGGRIIAADGAAGPANLYRLCVKGRFGFDYAHHPDRLTRPLVRREGVAKDPGQIPPPGEERRAAFREASWDEALEIAARGLAAIRDRDGGAALAGFGSAKGSNEEAYLFQKLIRAGFVTNNVDHCTRLCHASSVAALMEGLGSAAVTAPFMAAKDADVIIVIGSRPAQNHPVAATFIKNAVKRGAKLVVMDPRRQALSRHAEYMVQFASGMDVVLLNAMIYTIIAEGLTDNAYIARHVEGFEELKSKIAAFVPEKVAAQCGVEAAVIRAVARLYATAKRAIIYWGMGVSQHVHGTDNVRALIALSLICGHIGREGCGLHPLRGQNNVQGASDVGLIPMVYPDYKAVSDPAVRDMYQRYWGVPLSDSPGLTVVEIINAARAGTIKGMYIMGENPAMSDPDAAHARQGLAALEHLVVQDIFLTETAWLADVILPASSFFEKEGTFTNTNRQVQMAHPVVPMPGDARQDLWIVQQIARRIGLDWGEMDAAAVFDEMHGVMASIKGMSWARLQREGAVTYPCAREDAPGQDILFGDGFPTKTGKGRLAPTDFCAPDELPDDDYPFILTTGRMLEHWHTGAISRHAGILHDLEPVAVVSLNPATLRRLEAQPGDTLRVGTRRGVVDIQARADRDVPDGMVFIPFCFYEAAANLLTNPKLDPSGKIPEFKVCAAKVEKA
ncbi:formate dehydrogenase subunit alpha [Varunaivibrio sulfuroxidans]|uniref:NAD-dependent formate dehydrogenase catalytic subunit /NAD-dependent formate dehydrogenase iron-sulfur protein n=1 Tax=Varunaivibrio sulfuroxidans TaxID=1773489 RepID=A0A4R3JA89_9PROT|nr:formate dehydrogenase subunit alpha [Varunaivibrio sulfuroxidans]TCS62522.1 NAD-dependent formate dehydrogenase catalytic subunit /NAD-dependent formate dehydrogenase iron-sulfur protein [Varunaivibrio sulfuroxidans]WES30807.1 formate dehydrogenase subunit alpha [Varunaivibrio sulfuroxidans]